MDEQARTDDRSPEEEQADLEVRAEESESVKGGVGDDAQLANVDLQNRK